MFDQKAYNQQYYVYNQTKLKTAARKHYANHRVRSFAKGEM